MSRPTILKQNNVLTWTIKLYDDDDALVDADSDPTVVVYKNGVVTADVVTVTKRSSTTGIYDCSYDPAGEVEGDLFSIEETCVISSATAENEPWAVIVMAAEFDPTSDTVDVGKIAGSTDAATNLAASAETIKRCTVDTTTNTHTPTVTEFQTAELTEATAEHFNGRIVYFKTGALADQATDITSYAQVGGIGQLTVTALTEAPADGDEFIII